MDKMKYLVPLVLFWGIILSCEKKEEFTPLPLEDMQYILTQMHLADAVSDNKGGPLVKRRALREDLQVEILEDYEMDKETFLLHYEYYVEHPVLLDSVYKRMLRDLEARHEKAKQEKIQRSKENMKENQDSTSQQPVKVSLDSLRRVQR